MCDANNMSFLCMYRSVTELLCARLALCLLDRLLLNYKECQHDLLQDRHWRSFAEGRRTLLRVSLLRFCVTDEAS